MDTIMLQSGFATLVLEALKWFVYTPLTWVVQKVFKAPTFQFVIPVQVYLVLLPVLNLLAVPVLALAGFAGFTTPTDPVSFFRQVAQLVITSLISVLLYNNGVKPTQTAISAQ